MIIGIVGHEAAKFNLVTEALARKAMVDILTSPKYRANKVVSGGCHLGGIDIWAVEEAKKLGLPFVEHLPKTRAWEGYKERNLAIAKDSDIVFCIVVKSYPENYKGMRFNYCYHCKSDQHIKSGGCWTVKQAKRMGKQGEIVVL